MSSNFISKYNVPGPRYTSYPTVPYWDDNTFSTSAWKSSLKRSFKGNREISLYIHLPFCESLCTFCGCNKRITKKHSVETPYIETVLREWDLYLEVLEEKPIIREVHLGGGTPTFFAPENLKLLLNMLFRKAERDCKAELSFEGHPNNTTKEHLKVLAELGFRRVSYGVQDYSEKVQKAIHRIQPFQNVKNATEHAREAGFTSVGHDIIFGLPFQTKDDIIDTIEKTKQLMPDRIAFYSYAHVPWIKGNGQRGFKDSDLPGGDEKREMYETGKKMLEDAGYIEIGMDHFALKTDSLYKAVENKTLHRNFMGYTTSSGASMIGLGVSAISDSWYGFAQNEKSVETYQELIANGIIPVFRGHILNEEDLVIRKHILNLMCRLETSWAAPEDYFEELPDVLIKLREMEADGLVIFSEKGLTIPEKGRPFVRNICMAFDLRMQAQKPNTQLFSMTV
ncbi:coproporphyrinogen III oxidase [Salegentibacter salinarum]|uniref:Coproporphyrinogen-III oxidase n=1 Tax=Salegentibacter salinarum TaxID=447422 RepID=A0A2N0TMY5_9FLAO|nr:oxygen-independent coproporphyrinogen III oxidase [Salegentibacter salinarum]PKD16092.1 coproporphyrinogen III oxidase [Salegentibacter salinarum]SKB69421.1 oxygen-independent coproporphyrinogen-3 oxidase [Salegentibacter salinarum]